MLKLQVNIYEQDLRLKIVDEVVKVAVLALQSWTKYMAESLEFM